jgi:hypothetical protein
MPQAYMGNETVLPLAEGFCAEGDVLPRAIVFANFAPELEAGDKNYSQASTVNPVAPTAGCSDGSVGTGSLKRFFSSEFARMLVRVAAERSIARESSRAVLLKHNAPAIDKCAFTSAIFPLTASIFRLR